MGNYARRIYRIGYEENPPLHFTGRDGRPSGLVVDVIEEAARRKRIRLNWVLQEGGSEAALRSNQVDLWPLIMITPERQKVIHISAPFAENIDFLIVRKESKYHRLSELENATLAYRGEEIDRRFLRTHAPMARLVVLKKRGKSWRPSARHGWTPVTSRKIS